MSTRAVCAALCLLAATPARADSDDVNPPRRDPAVTANDGLFLPQTTAARIGDQRVSAMVLGGYDSAVGGPALSAAVEGALYRRVAIRVGVDSQGIGGAGTAGVFAGFGDRVSYSAGAKVGILRQEQHGIDLAVMATYRSRGLTQHTGEIEIGVAASRRWNRFGLYANLAYGQGFDVDTRDAAVRVAALYNLGERWQLGLDARARFDIGSTVSDASRYAPEVDFDLLAGPTASVALGPVILLAQAGARALVFEQRDPVIGIAALGGLGTSF